MMKVFDSSRRMSRSIRLTIRPSVFAVVFLTVAGGVARIAAASRGGLFCDEAQAIWIVRMPTWTSVASFLRDHESHPPLYYWLLREWLAAFGDTERSAVALSIVLGTILIPVVYRVSMRMFSERVGLIACTLSTVAPLLFQYSTKVRPYSLLPLLCTLSIYYLWISLTEMRFRDWFAYVVSTLLLLYTHNWSWLVFAGEWGVVSAWFVLFRPDRAEATRKRVVALILSQVAISAGYLPWIGAFLGQARKAGYSGISIDSRFILIRFLQIAGVEATPIGGSIVSLIGTISVFLGLCARQTAPNDRTINEFQTGSLAVSLVYGVPTIAVIAAFAFSGRSNLAPLQCFTTIAPMIAIGIALAVNRLDVVSSKPIACISIIFILFYMIFNNYLISWSVVGSNSREAASFVSARFGAGDRVLIHPRWVMSSFVYYEFPINYLIDYPDFRRVPAFPYDDAIARLLDPSDFDRFVSEIDRAYDERRRVWFVCEHNDAYSLRRDDAIPFLDRALGHTRLGFIRSEQTFRALERRYGTGRLVFDSDPSRMVLERLRVWLFDPGRAGGDLADSIQGVRSDRDREIAKGR